ncbi:hypothetical protein [Pseudoalteromonas undina]|uniref:hypothetical protein n=1 Tax=Pseudoalteromonas undina TaxID=43660 RepID=UPI0006BAC456|nr:hypothetical protein [Pseudoalteromonas undina]
MNTKSNNPDLGAVECDGCGGFAAVRQQKTGKKYLYLHCKNCGMDKRSGEKLQAKWQKAIGEKPPELPALNSEPAPQNLSAGGEWIPPEVKNEIERINNESKTTELEKANARTSEPAKRINNEQNSISTSDGGVANGFGFFICGAFAGLAAIAGLRR